MLEPAEQFELVKAYAQFKGIEVQCKDRLGAGIDGTVWSTQRSSAVKVLYSQKTFENELEAYKRLKAAEIRQLNEFHVPLLIDFDSDKRLIEISIVKPPYVLDFGKVYFDEPPTAIYTPQQLRQAEFEARHLYGADWPRVAKLLRRLQSDFGIWYLDAKPANINLGPFKSSTTDDDWDSEPPTNYEFEDDAQDLL
jgi:hypothetical protein